MSQVYIKAKNDLRIEIDDPCNVEEIHPQADILQTKDGNKEDWFTFKHQLFYVNLIILKFDFPAEGLKRYIYFISISECNVDMSQSNIEAKGDLEIDDQSNDEEKKSNSKFTEDTELPTISKIIIEATFESGLDQSFGENPMDSKPKVETTPGDKVHLNKEVGISSC